MRKIVVVAVVIVLVALGVSRVASAWSRPVPVFSSTQVSFTSPHLPDIWRLNLWANGKLLATTTEPDSGTLTIVLPQGVCGEILQADVARVIGKTFQYYSGARYAVPDCGGSTTTTTVPVSPNATTTTTTILPAPVHYPPPAPVVISPAVAPNSLGGSGTPGSISFTG
jgi:hypothetical protein